MLNEAFKRPAKGIVAVLATVSLASAPFALTGCFFGGGGDDKNKASQNSQNGNTKKSGTLKETTYELVRNAENDMCNRALKFTITDVQRRPMSIFAGSSIDASSSAARQGAVSAAATESIIIQIDISYTWNVNTYTQACKSAGTKNPKAPKTLGELLQPGVLLFVEGTDADGNLYRSGDIVQPDPPSDVNQLAINSQWNYNALAATLPETSVRNEGSILLRVTSTAENLKLILYTPVGGQDVTDKDAVASGSVLKYVMPLT